MNAFAREASEIGQDGGIADWSGRLAELKRKVDAFVGELDPHSERRRDAFPAHGEIYRQADGADRRDGVRARSGQGEPEAVPGGCGRAERSGGRRAGAGNRVACDPGACRAHGTFHERRERAVPDGGKHVERGRNSPAPSDWSEPMFTVSGGAPASSAARPRGCEWDLSRRRRA
jgi:hypothetical protein